MEIILKINELIVIIIKLKITFFFKNNNIFFLINNNNNKIFTLKTLHKHLNYNNKNSMRKIK